MPRKSVPLMLCAFVVSALFGSPRPSVAASAIARFPLLSDSLDATGNNDPMILRNAPFQDGGVYCNGIYPSLPGGADVETRQIPALNFDSFAVSVEFKIDDYPSPMEYLRPVVVGGFSYRWIGAEIAYDGTIGLLYNNNNHEASGTTVSLSEWHKIVIAYDSTSRTGNLYLDDQIEASAVFDLVQGGDRDFLALNPATGGVFKGVLRELVVYDSAYDPTPTRRTTWGAVKALYRSW